MKDPTFRIDMFINFQELARSGLNNSQLDGRISIDTEKEFQKSIFTAT